MASKKQVSKLKKTVVEDFPRPSAGQRVTLWDTEVKGFGVRVASSGTRTYILRYRVIGGRTEPQRTFTIGQHGSPWTTDQARKRALDLLTQVRAGIDPAEVRDAGRKEAEATAGVRADRMFALVADRWFKQHVVAGGLRSEDDIRGVLDRDLKPAFADHTVDEITKELVAEVVEKIGDRSHDAANKAFKWLRQMLNWCAKEKGILQASSLEGAGLPYKEGRRTRTLSLMEIVVVWVALDGLPQPFRAFYRLLILLGQRLREVANVPWSEFDMEAGDWVIPATRTKNQRDHLVPMSEQAITIVEALQPEAALRRGPAITTDGKVGISGFSKLKERVDELVAELVASSEEARALVGAGVAEWVVHDLRRSLATGCQGLGVPIAVTEAVLNHASGSLSGIVGLYQLYDYYDEKADALQRWGDLLDAALACWARGDVAGILALNPARRTRRRRRREKQVESGV
ncbi:Integrase [Sphingomonas palmae]|uniref:Integrase n=1 Tax=Sphingomonas palmae TaxID=1855283 RepID=A0A1H7T804_9SPHN|nr:site-specific integrase [Sphingomonas palmae]SEL81032.1 Integrase [Sphingomonas palmae]